MKKIKHYLTQPFDLQTWSLMNMIPALILFGFFSLSMLPEAFLDQFSNPFLFFILISLAIICIAVTLLCLAKKGVEDEWLEEISNKGRNIQFQVYSLTFIVCLTIDIFNLPVDSIKVLILMGLAVGDLVRVLYIRQLVRKGCEA